jgi:thymidine phosphorylase
MSATDPAPIHIINLIRMRRDGGALNEREIEFMVAEAVSELAPLEEFEAVLMKCGASIIGQDDVKSQ